MTDFYHLWNPRGRGQHRVLCGATTTNAWTLGWYERFPNSPGTSATWCPECVEKINPLDL